MGIIASRRDQEFAEFVQQRSGRLLLIARTLCADPYLAEDLTQATLERAYLKWGRVAKAEDPFGYVRRILINIHHDRMRRYSAHERPVDLAPEANRGHEPASGDNTATVAERQLVHRMLAELTARERAVVVLRFCADLSEAETARELGIAVGTVKSACARALAKLRGLADIQGLQEA